jgi:uncharacterized damage-inducible protein DinB
MMKDPTVAQTFLDFSVRRLQMSAADIAACVAQLDEEQLWRRGGEHENSIANLLLHLAGNMRQWVLHGIAGHPDVRERDSEFTLAPRVSGLEALATFRATLDECCEVIRTTPASRLLEIIDPQPNGTWRNLPILEAIYQVVGHVQLHAGQIIVLTKQMAAHDLNLSMPRKR